MVIWDFDSIYCKKIKFLIKHKFSLEIAKKCRNVRVCISTQPHTHTHTHNVHTKSEKEHLLAKKGTSLGFCFNKCLMLKEKLKKTFNDGAN